MAESEATKTYRGNCHCGSYIFEVQLPEIKSAMVCNCSICTKKSYMWLYPPKESFTVVKDDGILSEYKFGSFGIVHKFCSKCGTPVLGTMGDTIALNARAIENLDVWKLDIKPYDGAKLGTPYSPPTYSGPEPTIPSDSGSGTGHIYYGTCHCGAVKAAMKLTSPLDDTYPESIVQCNCSICKRAGFTWIYPKSEQVVLEGSENLTTYEFNRKIFNKTFCKTCGVYLTNDVNSATTEEEMASWPEATRQFRKNFSSHRPFNLQALNGFDLKKLKAKRLDGASSPPLYEAP